MIHLFALDFPSNNLFIHIEALTFLHWLLHPLVLIIAFVYLLLLYSHFNRVSRGTKDKKYMVSQPSLTGNILYNSLSNHRKNINENFKVFFFLSYLFTRGLVAPFVHIFISLLCCLFSSNSWQSLVHFKQALTSICSNGYLLKLCKPFPLADPYLEER